MAESEEERHRDGCRDWPDGFDQAAERIAAKRDLFNKGCNRKSDEVEKKQAEGARLRPELDVQCAFQRRRKNGDQNTLFFASVSL